MSRLQNLNPAFTPEDTQQVRMLKHLLAEAREERNRAEHQRDVAMELLDSIYQRPGIGKRLGAKTEERMRRVLNGEA